MLFISEINKIMSAMKYDIIIQVSCKKQYEIVSKFFLKKKIDNVYRMTIKPVKRQKEQWRGKESQRTKKKKLCP